MTDLHLNRLAQVEGWGRLDVCQHGTVHLLWQNLTIRLTLEAFQRTAALLDQGSLLFGPTPLCDGELCLAIQGAGYRLSIGPLDLSLTADAFLALWMLVKEARLRLATLSAAGEGHRPSGALGFDFDPDQLLQLHRFSLS